MRPWESVPAVSGAGRLGHSRVRPEGSDRVSSSCGLVGAAGAGSSGMRSRPCTAAVPIGRSEAPGLGKIAGRR